MCTTDVTLKYCGFEKWIWIMIKITLTRYFIYLFQILCYLSVLNHVNYRFVLNRLIWHAISACVSCRKLILYTLHFVLLTYWRINKQTNQMYHEVVNIALKNVRYLSKSMPLLSWVGLVVLAFHKYCFVDNIPLHLKQIHAFVIQGQGVRWD